MKFGRRTTFLILAAVLGVLNPPVARGDFQVNGAFGPNGDVGFVTSPPSLSISFGAQGTGSISQMDGFVNVPSLNSGSSYDLGNGPPANIGYTFSESQPTPNQLLLAYRFVNNTGAALPGFQFLYYVDPDIATSSQNVVAVNNNSTLGSPGAATYQAGDGQYSSIFYNVMMGSLDNLNTVPTSSPGDAAIALGFNVGSLAAGNAVIVDVLLSDNGASIGNFALTQSDAPGDMPFSMDTITVSGLIVPEPSSMILVGIGAVAGLGGSFRRRVRAWAQAWTRSQ